MTMRDDLSLTLVGDIMPAGHFSEHYAELKDSFLPQEAASWFDSDIVFCNLECGASNAGEPPADKIATYCFPEALGVLSRLHVTAASIANNHHLDYGLPASIETRRLLEGLNVLYAGAGANADEAHKPILIERKGRLISIQCFSWTTEFQEVVQGAGDDVPGVARYDREEILDEMARVKRLHSPDLMGLSLHWGEGKSHHVKPENVKDAHAFVDAGAGLIIGHHTHCLQGYEIYRGAPVFYGLGNFLCSPYRKLPNKRLTYGNEGVHRYRWLRERKTLIARVVFPSQGDPAIALLPLLQLDMPPVLTMPPARLAKKIRRDVARFSRRLRSPLYPNGGYALYRRVDEVKRIIEDAREQGLRREHFSCATLKRVVRKLVEGQSHG